MVTFPTIGRGQPVKAAGTTSLPLISRVSNYLLDRSIHYQIETNEGSKLWGKRCLPAGSLQTISLRLEQSQIKSSIFPGHNKPIGDHGDPLSQAFDQALAAGEKVSADLTYPKRAELIALPGLLRRFAGVTAAALPVEEFLLTVPRQITLSISFLDGVPLTAACPEVKQLSDVLTADYLSPQGPRQLHRYENGLLYWRSDTEEQFDRQFHFVRLQRIPAQKLVAEVAVNFRDEDAPRLRSRFFKIGPAGILQYRSGNLFQSFDSSSLQGQSGLPASLISSADPDLMAAAESGLSLAQKKVAGIKLEATMETLLGEGVQFSIARDRALTSVLAGEMIAWLNDHPKKEPAFAPYLRYLPETLAELPVVTGKAGGLC